MGLLAIGLTGCAAQSEIDVGTRFSETAGFQAHIKIESDLGDAALIYEMNYTYNRDGADVFTLTAPECIAGISGTIAGADSSEIVLQYDGTELDDALPRRPGLTAADGLFYVLASLRNAEPVQSWEETVNGTKTRALRYEDAETDTARQVWLTEDGRLPLYAEAYDGSRCVLKLQITDYQENKG